MSKTTNLRRNEKNSLPTGSNSQSTLNYYLPFTPAEILHEFDGENHLGMDIAVPFGSDIKAMIDGIVEEIVSDADGIKVSVSHIDGSNNLSVYSHLSSLADGIAVGSYVNQDITIGASGKTANKSERLHLALISDGQYVNPRSTLRFYTQSDLSRVVAAADGAKEMSGANWDEQLIGNAGPLDLKGLDGNDDYYVEFEPTSNNYNITDTGGDINIATAGGYFTIAGNAQPKTDSAGNVINDKWTLSQGFDLEKNGNDLVIYHAGSNPKNAQTSTITIKDYPFDQDQETFGFTLGKTLLGTDYDSHAETLTEQRSYQGGPLLKSSDGNSFYTILKQDTTGLSSGFRFFVGKIGSNGVLIEQIEINSDFPITQTGAPTLYVDPTTSKESLAIPYASKLTEGGFDQTRIGICVVNGDGVQASQIIESASSADGKSLSQASFREQPTSEYFELAYQTQSGRVAQKVSLSNLEKVGEATATDNTRVIFKTSTSLEFTDGNKIALNSGILVANLPKLRSQTGAEIIPNYVVNSGKQSASDSVQQSIISIDPSLDQEVLDLTIPYNHNSTVVLMAESAFASGRSFTVKLPVDDLSEAFIYSTSLTAEQIFNGEFEIPASSKKLTLAEKDAALVKNGPDTMRIWEEAVKDLADSDDDYSLDLSGVSLQDQAQQSAVIVLPDNQKIFLAGSDATEIQQSLSTYFAVQDPINLTAQPSGEPTIIPTMVPSSNPSGQPSYIPTPLPSHQPSGQPTRVPIYTWNPTGQPSFQPVGHPSSLPTGTPTYYLTEGPTGQPTAIPTRLPSGKPTSLPTLIPSAQPSAEPTYKPSNYPTSQPSGLPSPMPSYIPSAVPNPDPTGHPSYIPTLLPSNQPTRVPTYTYNPTTRPSYQPTSGPTLEPTFYLTCNPTTNPTEITAIPTLLPSGEPTSLPSICPSAEPTAKPTFTPSNYPTRIPTRMPTNKPSSHPTQTPTLLLTARPNPDPTGIPSFFPTLAPSHQPSGEPTESQLYTYNPSGQPSFLPTTNPSNEPTYIITYDPTSQPTKIIAVPSRLPSGAPTSYPSMSMDLTSEPSFTPSNHPSYQPSSLPSLAATKSNSPSLIPSLYSSDTTWPSAAPSLEINIPPVKALTGHKTGGSPWNWGRPLAVAGGAMLLITAGLAYFFRKKRGETENDAETIVNTRYDTLDAAELEAGGIPLTEINVGVIDISALDNERAAAARTQVVAHALAEVSSAQTSQTTPSTKIETQEQAATPLQVISLDDKGGQNL